MVGGATRRRRPFSSRLRRRSIPAEATTRHQSVDSLSTRLGRLVPGLALCILLGGLALGAQSLVAFLPAVAVALAAGMSARVAIGDRPRLDPGIAYAARTLLRLAVALMGARLSIDVVAGVGSIPLILAIASVAGTLPTGYAIGRLLGLTRGLSLTASGATAICGASAALAIAATLPAGERRQAETVFAVVGVTALSTVAMLVYPWAAGQLGTPDIVAGLFFGATIHDVAQVVGAGALVSVDATAVATYTKMLRVMLLAPVVTITAIIALRWETDAAAPKKGWRALVPPPFVIAFLILGAATVAGLIPDVVRQATTATSSGLLVVAIAALGFRTTVGGLASFGLRGLGYMLMLTALIAAIGFTLLALLA